jgi:GxxExxY protein
MDQDPKTYAVIGAAMAVHREMGCGLPEVFYQDALEIELRLRNIPFTRETPYHVFYKGEKLRSHMRPDFVCFGEIIIELKALSEITGREEAQILGYLKAAGFQIGLLINFGTPSLFTKRFIHSSRWLPEAVQDTVSV